MAHLFFSVMADDLANDWGISLVLPGRDSSRHCSIQHCIGTRDHADNRVLRDVLNATFGGLFCLDKVAQSGSDAQFHAIFKATGGDVN